SPLDAGVGRAGSGADPGPSSHWPVSNLSTTALNALGTSVRSARRTPADHRQPRRDASTRKRPAASPARQSAYARGLLHPFVPIVY
ncbi:MAG TPA: hypothetical protein VI893_05695, partial [Thermoplasmata archaeon]|nr:hypothetical protein [Thermoplasmata archaeon]